LLGLLAAPPVAAFAQTPAAADWQAREADARRACESGRVDEGARLLGQLLDESKDATYIFNLGRCFEQNDRVDSALAQFRAYLARKEVDAAAAAHARAFIAAHEQPAAPANAPRPAQRAEPGAVRPTTGTASTATSAASMPASPGKTPGQTWRMAGLASGALGVLGLAGGVYYGLETARLENEKRAALARDEQSQEWFTQHDAKGERAERLQKVLLAAGGVALATGAVSYYLGVRAGIHADATTARAYPLLLPGGAGAALGGRF
jgi:hypothetical protein